MQTESIKNEKVWKCFDSAKGGKRLATLLTGSPHFESQQMSSFQIHCVVSFSGHPNFPLLTEKNFHWTKDKKRKEKGVKLSQDPLKKIPLLNPFFESNSWPPPPSPEKEGWKAETIKVKRMLEEERFLKDAVFSFFFCCRFWTGGGRGALDLKMTKTL